MTVSRAISSLYLFQSKVEEAVNLVPSMCAEDKLKAVQFWNMVSEKLQDIVNNSAADINAIALKLDEEENAKMNLAMNNQENLIHQNNAPVAEFATMSSNYICDESTTQLHANLETSGTITSLTHTDHLNMLHANISEINIQSNQYIEHIPMDNKCDTFSRNLQSSDSHILDNHISLSSTKETLDLQLLQPNMKVLERNNDFELGSSSSVIVDHKSSKTLEPILNLNVPEMSRRTDALILCDNSETKMSEDGISMMDMSSESNFETFEGSNSEEVFPQCDVNQSPDTNFETSGDDKRSLTCTLCSKDFTDEDSLNRHHLKMHERHFSCTECKATFTAKGNLRVHMRRHTGEKPYCCHKCPANFTTRGNLKRHFKTHSGEKPWQCSKCGTCFTEKKSLTIHMRKHTGEKPYQCKECGKSFTQTSILQTHMAMHMDIRIHLCEKCGKSFRQKSQLRIHRLRHDNVRLYDCPSCSLKFLTKGDLLRHKITHTKEKPFSCDMCTKCFTRQQSLNEHKNRHFGLKPYKCKHCGKAFPEMSGCYKHMKSHDQVKEEDNNVTANNVMSKPVGTHAVSDAEGGPPYIAVVVNAKDPAELGTEINHAVSFLNSGGMSENINGLGVVTALNLLTNAATLPQNVHIS